MSKRVLTFFSVLLPVVLVFAASSFAAASGAAAASNRGTPPIRLEDFYISFIVALVIISVLSVVLYLKNRRLNNNLAELFEKRTRELERMAADERAKIMLEATPLGCSLIDRDLNIIDCNAEAVKLFGLKDKSEFMNDFFRFSPEFQPDGQNSKAKAKKLIDAGFQQGREHDRAVFEWMHQKADGTPIPSEITLVRVMRGDDSVVAGYTRDLREQNKMLRELDYKGRLLHTVNNMASQLLRSEPEEFERNLWHCMGLIAEPVGADRVYVWKNYTRDGKLYCTQVFEWSEGAPPQQGTDVAIEASYDDMAVGWEQKLSSDICINSPVKELSPEEQAALTPQGILSILVVPVFLRGEFWGFVGFDECKHERVFSDDEETVLRSASILIANALLRNEMTLAIRAAVEKAQAASLAKSNFLSNMSHEIRTPLNAIIGMTTIGKAGTDIERKDYAFDRISNASTHLLGIINDILDMSKIEADKLELHAEDFSFEKMVQNVVNVVSFRMHERDHHFSVFIDKDIPNMLNGDSKRLGQVITNLLSNAAKFTPEGGSIRFFAGLDSIEGDIFTIRVEVTDSGIGIDPEKQAKLFKPFEQIENTMARRYEGTGLGLAISRRIVELMGGEVWVDSELGKGSKFAFIVKLRKAESPAEIPLIALEKRESLRIMAVDDDSAVREFFEAISEQFGIKCDTADGGESALRLINSGSIYNIFFVDWSMPGMNGIELSREIKARSEDKAVVIMISSHDWSSIESEANAAGVDRFLSKPMFTSSVMDSINECLGVSVENKAENPLDEAVFNGNRLLLAEDVEINREIVLSLLEPTGIEVDCAENGAQALEMFSGDPGRYDMVFMDVHMPEMDGLEATRRIRALDNKKAGTIPIVAMTANVFREDVEQCMKAGMNDHIGKPLDINEMLYKMKIWLNKKH